jgi:hypothetical protein
VGDEGSRRERRRARTDEVFASWAMRATRAVLALVATSLVAVLVAGDGAARWRWPLVTLAAGAVLVARALRIGLVLRADEVVVRNPFLSYRVPLSEIAAVDTSGVAYVLPLSPRGLVRRDLATVERTDGRVVESIGAAGDEARRAMRSIRQALPG